LGEGIRQSIDKSSWAARFQPQANRHVLSFRP
jgi:hypothetical protein